MTIMIELIKQMVMQNRDNLFSANHRRAMIEKYGYTSAQNIKIEDLIYDR